MTAATIVAVVGVLGAVSWGGVGAAGAPDDLEIVASGFSYDEGNAQAAALLRNPTDLIACNVAWQARFFDAGNAILAITEGTQTYVLPGQEVYISNPGQPDLAAEPVKVEFAVVAVGEFQRPGEASGDCEPPDLGVSPEDLFSFDDFRLHRTPELSDTVIGTVTNHGDATLAAGPFAIEVSCALLSGGEIIGAAYNQLEELPPGSPVAFLALVTRGLAVDEIRCSADGAVESHVVRAENDLTKLALGTVELSTQGDEIVNDDIVVAASVTNNSDRIAIGVTVGVDFLDAQGRLIGNTHTLDLPYLLPGQEGFLGSNHTSPGWLDGAPTSTVGHVVASDFVTAAEFRADHGFDPGPTSPVTVSDARPDLESGRVRGTVTNRSGNDFRVTVWCVAVRDGRPLATYWEWSVSAVSAGSTAGFEALGPWLSAAAARRTDEVRCAAYRELVFSASETGGFRPTGPLVPKLTTEIPTPTDVSTDPAVVGANLLLAGLVMVLFTFAVELLNRALAESEEALERVFRPARWLGRVQHRIDSTMMTRVRRGAWVTTLRLAGIVAVYGLIFSLLEPGWNPFSVTGFYLFLAMAVAFGVAGLAGDYAKWKTARGLGVRTDLALRPANLALALASTGFSRVFAIIPGLMFGKPEAFEIDEASLEPPKETRLVTTGAVTLLGVGVGAWLITTLTALVQRRELPEWLAVPIGGIEALLLLVFAVAVQNMFVEMLTVPGRAGRVLAKRHPRWWFAGLLGITFLFWYTLINPRGDLTSALKTSNVRFFLITVTIFVVFAIGVWSSTKFRARQRARTETQKTPSPAPTAEAHGARDET